MFHAGAGAIIGQLVRDYRPKDVINFGHGVLITYDIRKTGSDPIEAPAFLNGVTFKDESEASKLVCDTLDSLSCAADTRPAPCRHIPLQATSFTVCCTTPLHVSLLVLPTQHTPRHRASALG